MVSSSVKSVNALTNGVRAPPTMTARRGAAAAFEEPLAMTCLFSFHSRADEGAAAEAQRKARDSLRAGAGEEHDPLTDVLRLPALSQRRHTARAFANGERDGRRHAR